jgi:hypothetical protein
MTTTFSDLIAETTEAAVYSLVRTAGTIVGLDFEKMPPNGVVRTIAKSVFSKVVFGVFGTIVPTIARGGFLDFATDGPWLEVNGEQVHETERIRLSYATTTVGFVNTSANVYNFVDGQVIVQHGTSKKTYRCAAFRIEESGAPNNLDEATVVVTATEPGSASSAAADDIDTITTAFDGLEITASGVAVGTDLEPRTAYIERCRLAAAATSPAGAAQAYEYIALSSVDEDGVSRGITKVQVVSDTVDGTVQVYVDDGDGSVAGDVVSAIETELLSKVVPHGTDFLGVSAATPITIDIEYTALALNSVGLSVPQIEALVASALADLFNDKDLNPIGGVNNTGASGFMYQSKIRSTIEQVQAEPGSPRPIIDVNPITSPAGNTTINNGQIAILGDITHGITLV